MMNSKVSKPSLLKTSIAASVLLFASGMALAQSAVTLSAGPSNATLPDGQLVPMWGYSCSAVSGTDVSCAPASGAAPVAGAWQPPKITVPAGQPLTITLVNNLNFGADVGQQIPTSLVIVGQLGGGLGDKTQRTTTPSPAHPPQGTTWPGTLGGIDPATAAISVVNPGAGYLTPPAVNITGGGINAVGAAAVATIGNGIVTGVTVSNVGIGYTSAPTVTIDLPPCTLNGTTCVRATATMNLTVLLSSTGDATFVPPAQADRVRSFATEVNVSDAGGKALTWSNLRAGTYLIESGTQPSIQGAMGLYGILVVTDPLATPSAPQAYGTTYDAEVALLLSEIDPVQNTAVDLAVRTSGFNGTAVWDAETIDPKTGLPGCGLATVHTCYPPAVNYSPLYYLVNGVSFSRTAGAVSAVPVALPTTAATGRVLLRFVNAGLRMHVPSVVGANLTLLAEDGNKIPGLARVQSEVFLAAGKAFDVTIQPTLATPIGTSAGTYANTTYPVFDRALNLSTSNQRDGGMQTYITVGTGTVLASTALSASNKSYTCFSGTTLAITDPALGVLAGATGANGAVLTGTSLPGGGTLDFHSNGTFTYVPPASGTCAASFAYSVNGTIARTATITDCAGNSSCAGAAPTAGNATLTSTIATQYKVAPPGVLAYVTNPGKFDLTATPPTAAATLTPCASATVYPDGSFVVTPSTTSPAICRFNYNLLTSTGQSSTSDGVITVNFLTPSNLTVNVKDAKTGLAINDYRWIIEEDKTFWIDPKCQVNTTPRPVGCAPLPVESLGYNFHTAYMPVVAQGCVGTVSCEANQTRQGERVACDIGNGDCRPANQKTELRPGAVHLDPAKRYFISILPGDGENPTVGGAGGPDDNGKAFDIAAACGPYTGPTGAWEPGGAGAMCGHAMGGAQIAPAQTLLNVLLQQTPLPTAKIGVFVFEDDNPLNGENDAGGGIDVIAPNEPGLGGFEIKIFDQAGGLGDATGQITYDEFNQPVSNSLANYIDPITGFDACPINTRGDGLVGMIPTCPKYENGNDPTTGLPVESPLAGQAVIANLYAGLYEIVAAPAADRIARGEEWLQTNTLDGGKAHEAFIKPNEPGYFQEFGPGGFHVAIGFANPKIIEDRRHNDAGTGICDPAPTGGGLTCNAELNLQVTGAHMSRTPDQRIYSSGNYDTYGFTQCYVSISPPDAADFAFQKCNPDGTVTFTGMPVGDFKLTVFDQWNDIMLDGLVSPVTIDGSTTVREFPVTQWRTDLSTRTFIDTNYDGVSQEPEPGLALVNTNIRYRDGSFGFFNNTDLAGNAGFNEVFPFMNWLVVETTATRFKQTGTHTVYDTGGKVDGCTNSTAAEPCGQSTIAAGVANTIERVSLPANQRVPGAVYCADADCTGASIATKAGNVAPSCATDANGITTCSGASAGRIDPPMPWGPTEGWQGLLGQYSFIEFGMKPFAPGENGGIQGHVIYASTRPFDDPALLLQLSWEPGVPHVLINLYRETSDASGNRQLQLVDHTTTSSWDDWAQGFRVAADGSTVPNMNCPGQDSTSPFFQTLKDSKQWLDPSNPKTPVANHALFKCYDGWSQLNQVQPAPYDGMYKFPSVTAVDPVTGRPTGTNCTACIANPTVASGAATGPNYDPFRAGTPMLPPGKYVVEVVVPQGFELVKEEDKNILLGDVYVAPVVTQFAGFGNIFIMPDQASVSAAYNANSPGSLNLTTDMGASPRHEGDTGSVETFWPCVGTLRQVPDLNSLYPDAGQAAPFAGAMRRLCDRKEVTLEDQASALTKFYVFSSTHIAGHFTGMMTNDFASEFDPFSPQFGEKFGPPNLPVAMRDFTGNEVARVYSDQWGLYNGLYFSTYSVNPPNPTGYVPQMSIACMNDPGPIADPANPGQMITDPSYNPAYSNFCYETPFMPGFTAYMDTPVIPTQAFADGYNLPDSEYPDLTPALGSVVGGSGVAGPWVSATGQTLTIRCLGADNAADPCAKVVQNPNYSGPNAATAPYNQKTIVRHYGFGTTAGTVTIAGATATCGTWTNVQLVCTVPTISATLNTTTGVGSTCYNGTSTTIPAGQTPAPRGISGASLTNYRCGELVITRGDNSKRSIDAITVTVAGSAPWVVTPTSVSAPTGKSVVNYAANFGRLVTPQLTNTLQQALDSASPGDLIIVTPGTYRENLIMWKPVRLQGVGASSVVINADAHPAGKMDSWRRQVACLFGLTIDGVPNPGNTAFDPSGTYSCPNRLHLRSDRIPFEAIVGWDAAGNGNLAQVLQEPTLMGAYEGAGITTLGRGIRIPAGSNDLWGQGTPGVAGAYPDGSRYLQHGAGNTAADCTTSTTLTTGRDYGTGNYQCNPSRIDGVSIINSSQGGGGIFMHGWNHYLEISNVRTYGNHGTLSGAINLGNGETPPLYTNDGTICNAGITPAPLCPPFGNAGPNNANPQGPSLIGAGTPVANAAIPFQLNVLSRIHHNMIINNASIGDALFSGTPSGSGGITISAGSDNYKVDHNWVAGNLSTGDGGGLGHQGVTFNGLIQSNWILFNQSTNPTLPTNGGGVLVAGASADRTLPNGLECGSVVDLDCPPGIGDGAGAGNVIDANLIMGNSAESGSGGGLRIQQVNGVEVGSFPLTNSRWYDLTITNNVIANNVAGWDGGGVSLQDALKVTFVNNTVASNDSTATAGALYKTLGAINSSSPPPGCVPTPDPMNPQNSLCLIPNAPHGPQPAGIVTTANTPNLVEVFNTAILWLCPVTGGFGYTGLVGLNGDCGSVSKPSLTNDMLWQNRSFRADIIGPGSNLQSQQNTIVLTPTLNQTTTGQCTAGASYWDLGIRQDDLAAGTVATGTQLTVNNSILTSTAGVPLSSGSAGNVVPGSSPVLAQICNGARVPPENCTNQLDQATCRGFNAPPGRSETTGLTTAFVFNNITPAATVDEGHNWLNLIYGPLTLNRTAVGGSTSAPELMVVPGSAGANVGVNGGAYTIPGTSAAVNRGTNSGLPATTATDYFGNPRARSTANPADIGAVEYPVTTATLVVANPAPLVFKDVVTGSGASVRDLVLTNNGTTTFTIPVPAFTGPFTRVVTGSFTGLPPNCGGTLAAGASCTIRVQWPAQTVVVTTTGSVTITGVSNSPVTINANAVAPTFLATVAPNPLAFGNWATGTTSNVRTLTVSNTGNSALSALTFGFGVSTANFARVTTGTFPASAPNCVATLAVGASCTVKVTFAPTATGAVSRNLTVTATGATITTSPVVLTGSGVATRATVAMAPLRIVLPSGTATDTGVAVLTNTAPATGAQLAVTNVAVSGGTLFTFFFNKVLGQDSCTGAALPPGGSCTVGVRFANVTSARGVDRSGSIVFTDNGVGSPQTFAITGNATP